MSTAFQNPINSKTYEEMAAMFLRLKTQESWRGKHPTQDGYSKEDKEALNLITFRMIAPIMLDESDDMSGFPAYVIKRLFAKSYTWDAKPANKDFFHQRVDNFDEAVETYVEGKVKVDPGMEAFADFLKEEANKLSPKVLRVFKAARELSTIIEYEEMAGNIRPDSKEDTRERVYSGLANYSDLPHLIDIANGVGEYGKIKELIRTISWARYTFRWQGYLTTVKTNILTHMLEAACIAYCMDVETGHPSNTWNNDFWVMMFHDLAEIWTDDIPSPVKDGVKLPDGTTLRATCEEQELLALETHFYSELDNEIANSFRKGVMLEDVKDPKQKKFYKAADYFAADLEVFWNIKGGSHEKRFLGILMESAGDNRTAAQLSFLKKIAEKASYIPFWD